MSDIEISSDELEFMTRDFEQEAEQVKNNLLPKKSADRYLKVFTDFEKWREKNKINSYDEKIFLVYFNELSSQFQPSTLWSKYSMIRSMLSIRKNINIKGYDTLRALLKNLCRGYIAKKSKTLDPEDIAKFLNNADDRIYLLMKVILIFGMFGALRTIEYCNLQTTDIDEKEDEFIIRVRDTKNYYPRIFIIGSKYFATIKKYMDLRPPDIGTKRFFINYTNGKCTSQPCGKQSIYKTPKTIASYLNLPEPETYTGHCFRRTSATTLADTGANSTTLKDHGGWRSMASAEGYVAHSLHSKRKVYNRIANAINNNPRNMIETSTAVRPSPPAAITKASSTISRPSPPATITKASSAILRPSHSASTTKATSTKIHSSEITLYDTNNFELMENNMEPTNKKLRANIDLYESNDSQDENLSETVSEDCHLPPTTTKNVEPLKSLNFNTNTTKENRLKSIENTHAYNSTKESTSKPEKNKNTSEYVNIETNMTKNDPTIVINIKEIHNMTVNYYYRFDKKNEKEN